MKKLTGAPTPGAAWAARSGGEQPPEDPGPVRVVPVEQHLPEHLRVIIGGIQSILSGGEVLDAVQVVPGRCNQVHRLLLLQCDREPGVGQELVDLPWVEL